MGGLADALRRGYGIDGVYWILLYGIPTTRGLAVNLVNAWQVKMFSVASQMFSIARGCNSYRVGHQIVL